MNTQNALHEGELNSILAQTFLQNCLSVALLDFNTGEALVLQCNRWPDMPGKRFPWQELVGRFTDANVFHQDRELVKSLTLERVRQSCMEGQGRFSAEARIISREGSYQWVEIAFAFSGPDRAKAIVSTHNIDEAILMRKIVDLFVYQNYDYLLMIDSKRDSYIRFTGGNGISALPPEQGIHYTEDMIRFNREFILPEESERVTANMQIVNVLEKLKTSETYSFTCCSLTVDRQFRQSRVKFLYYDRAAGLLLCARTDVTQIYLEEQEKSRLLADALRNAQHDALTEIYNRKATAELVARSLESRYHNLAAFLFIDVDNFKLVNDTYGHQKGDELLCFLAHGIEEIAGRDGIAGRLGGDEYLLYLPFVRSREEIRSVSQEVCRIFDTYPSEYVNGNMPTCSVGISVYPQDGVDYETLLHKADLALYAAKRHGKNQYDFSGAE